MNRSSVRFLAASIRESNNGNFGFGAVWKVATVHLKDEILLDAILEIPFLNVPLIGCSNFKKALQNLAGEILRQFEKRLATITVVLLPFLASFSEGSAKFDRKKIPRKNSNDKLCSQYILLGICPVID